MCQRACRLQDCVDGYRPFFYRVPRGTALETLHNLGVPIGMPFFSYLGSLRVIADVTVEIEDPLEPFTKMVIGLVWIRKAHHYPTLITTLLQGGLATRYRSFDSPRYRLHLLI